MDYRVLMALTSLVIIGCTTPRAVEEHHHHYYEADTAAVHAQVDRQLTSWHEDMTQFFQQRLEEYSASWFSHEDEKETVTETVTVSLDSIGREMRTEQRTISRSMLNVQSSMVNSIMQEYEARLRAAVDSLDGIYLQRYDSLASHVARLDTTLTKKTPAGDTRPWYQRWWHTIRIVLIVLVLAAVLWFLYFHSQGKTDRNGNIA